MVELNPDHVAYMKEVLAAADEIFPPPEGRKNGIMVDDEEGELCIMVWIPGQHDDGSSCYLNQKLVFDGKPTPDLHEELRSAKAFIEERDKSPEA